MKFYPLADLDVGVRDAAHVHGGQVGGLHHLHHQRLRVEVVLELVPAKLDLISISSKYLLCK